MMAKQLGWWGLAACAWLQACTGMGGRLHPTLGACLS